MMCVVNMIIKNTIKQDVNAAVTGHQLEFIAVSGIRRSESVAEFIFLMVCQFFIAIATACKTENLKH